VTLADIALGSTGRVVDDTPLPQPFAHALEGSPERTIFDASVDPNLV
jgi:hypothetical protein